ncbi:hypothetical protein [Brucella pituitosa]
MTIPDEAVQAAVDTIDMDDTYVGEPDHLGQFIIDGPINIKSMLTAAAPFLQGLGVDEKPYVDCACTKIQQDEHCLVGYPSLLCEICDGKGVVPPPCARALELSSLERIAKLADDYDMPDENGPFPDIQDAMVTVGDLRNVRKLFVELSAIEVSALGPSPRAQALEEAAKIAEDYVQYDVADAIRLLSSQSVADHADAVGNVEGDGWLPIETASKDRSEFLAWPCNTENGVIVVKAYWYVHPSVQAWITDEIDCGDFDFSPTHWRPLPASPGASDTRPNGGSNHGE